MSCRRSSSTPSWRLSDFFGGGHRRNSNSITNRVFLFSPKKKEIFDVFEEIVVHSDSLLTMLARIPFALCLVFDGDLKDCCPPHSGTYYYKTVTFDGRTRETLAFKILLLLLPKRNLRCRQSWHLLGSVGLFWEFCSFLLQLNVVLVVNFSLSLLFEIIKDPALCHSSIWCDN